MEYDVDFFLRKFEAIPEELWLVRSLQGPGGKACALGHCSWDNEATAFVELFNTNHVLLGGDPVTAGIDVNNGDNPNYQQPTPKQRILAALRDIKSKQSPPVEQPTKQERIVYVTVDERVRELQRSELSQQ